MQEPKNCPRCGAQIALTGALSGLCPACVLRGGMGKPAPGAKEEQDAPRTDTEEGAAALQAIRERFPELEIEALLGRGGMGLVYKARQTKLDRPVALKIMAPDLADQPAFSERFLREAQALARLNHPNVVAVHDFGERKGMYFLLMEYVDGAHLRELLTQRKLSPTEALKLVPDICSGLEYAHEQGIVHRDIKPENILVTHSGHAKIVDFGLVRVVGQEEATDWRLTRASQVMGTPQYMAPEQLNRPREVDHRADIYSLGVVLYEMLTAELPLGRFALPSERVQVDVRLDDVVLKALQREPEKRFQRAGEMGHDVEHISSHPNEGRLSRRRPGDGLGEQEEWPATLKIPFKNHDRLDGLIELRGIVGIEEDELIVEYRRTRVLNWRPSEIQETCIPFEQISMVELRKKLFRTELRLTVNRLKALEELPETRNGTFRMVFSRKDRSIVERLANYLKAHTHKA